MDSEYLFFWRSDHENGWLSNLYILPFTIDDIIFKSVEHYIVYNKAKVFNDIEFFDSILNTKNSVHLKKYEKKYNNDILVDNCFNILYIGIRNKFNQNLLYKQKLINTGNKIIIYASPFDNLLGIGMNEIDTYKLNENKWQKLIKNKNILGNILMLIRDEFSYYSLIPRCNINIIQVISCIYYMPDFYGDFNWMINNSDYNDSLFIFTDNEEYSNICSAGRGHTKIRQYNQYSNHSIPRSAAIPISRLSIINDIYRFNKSITTNDKDLINGYKIFDNYVITNINESIVKIRKLIKKYKYKRIFFQSNQYGTINTGKYNVIQPVCNYITKQLYSLENI
jgi:ribA/ribD-fused uncharacterized protein